MRISVFWKELGIESLFFHIGKSQLRWLRHLVKKVLVTSLSRCFGHLQLGRDPKAEPGHTGEITVGLGTLKELEKVAREKEVGSLCFGHYPCDPNLWVTQLTVSHPVPDQHFKIRLFSRD